MEIIVDLCTDPHPGYSKALKLGRELHGLHVIYVNGWRIVYQVKEDDLIVTVIAFRRRSPDPYLNL